MKIFKIISIIILSLFIVFMGCTLEEPDVKKTESNTGSYDLSRYVAIGNSLTAGFQSGSLVDVHQQYSFPKMIAGQLGIGTFEQPTVSYPGIPNIMVLESMTGDIGYAEGTGAPTNSGYGAPYDNLGIPGAVLNDILTAHDSLDCTQALMGSGANPAFDLVLRNPNLGGNFTVFQQAKMLQPTFITMWIGNNDVLGFASSGGVNAHTDEVTFGALYSQLADSIANLGAIVAVANIPDVTTIPLFTTLPTVIVDFTTMEPVLIEGSPVPWVGVNPASDLVILTAKEYMLQGYGIPVDLGGNGEPLPDHVVLDGNEVAEAQQTTAAFNEVIDSISTNKGFALFDAYTFFGDVAKDGYVPEQTDLDTLTAAYISGGLFSLDGVHPSNVGYAVVANGFIKAINAKFDINITEVNLRNVMGGAQAPASLAKYNINNLSNTVEVLGGKIK